MRKDQGGFTLTEVTLVVGLMLLFSALSIPILSSSFRVWQARSDTQNISTALLSAKFKATSRANRYRVAFDVPNNSWTFERYDSAGATWVPEGSPMQLSSGLSNSGIRLEASSASAPTGFPTTSSTSIIFSTRGIPIDSANSWRPTANNVVYLSGGQGNYAVTVSMAGRIHLWSLNNSTWVCQ